jgi:adhesin transport system membrane fusion protein
VENENRSDKESSSITPVQTGTGVDYIADSTATVNRRVPQKAANALYLLLAVIVVGFLWAYFAKLNVSTMANGKIISSSHTQAIQHLEGGIVKKISVKLGDHVKKGQVLVTLDDTRFAGEYKQGLTKLAVLEADIVRLKARADGKESIEFDPKFAAQNPVQVQEDSEMFYRDKAAFEKDLALLNKQKELLTKEIGIISPLAKQGVVSNVERIRLERDLANLEQNIQEKKNTWHDQAREQLNKAQGDYSVLLQSIDESKDRMARTIIRSPTSGIVNQVFVTTIGEVVKPGDTIVEVVPLEDKLTVQAFVRPSDIGFIRVGQKALVKVSAYDYSVFGGLEAKVQTIGADAVKDKNDESYYEVKLLTKKSYLKDKNDKKLQLIPGMTVTVSILTGEKTVLNYLLKPFIKAKESALQER